MSTFLQIWHRPSCPGVGCLEFHDLHSCTSNHRDAIGTCNSWLCILKMKLKMLNSLRTTYSHRMTHDGGRKPIAICHLSDYGQPINLYLYKDTSIYLNLF